MLVNTTVWAEQKYRAMCDVNKENKHWISQKHLGLLMQLATISATDTYCQTLWLKPVTEWIYSTIVLNL